MDAAELRNLSVEELRSRVKGWREEYFRAKFKGQTNEVKDTSIFRKLRKDIARGLMVLGEKTQGRKAEAPAEKSEKGAEK